MLIWLFFAFLCFLAPASSKQGFVAIFRAFSTFFSQNRCNLWNLWLKTLLGCLLDGPALSTVDGPALSTVDGLIVPLLPFHNKTHFNRLGRHPDAHRLAVNYRVNLLRIRLELPSRYARNLAAYAAKILRLAATGYRIAERYPFARIKTLSRHLFCSFT